MGLELLLGIVLSIALCVSGARKALDRAPDCPLPTLGKRVVGTLEIVGAIGLWVPLTAAISPGCIAGLMWGGVWTNITHRLGGAEVAKPGMLLVLALGVAALRWSETWELVLALTARL